MKRFIPSPSVLLLPWVLAVSFSPSQAAGEDAKDLAAKIYQATSVQGGLVVHLGCGDGHLTAALRAGNSYLVQGLDTDASQVPKARATIQGLGLYGKVTAREWDGNRLPYVDNLVNLVVASAPAKVARQEILRVLCPGGVAYLEDGGTWRKEIKPRSPALDDWTHYLHDASGNAVSHDSVIGPPRHLQWVGSPRWARHHDHMASMSALVSAGGRIFYIFDEGPTASIELPPKWRLVARDAFNGTVLWKRPIARWHNHLWPLKSGPAQLPRRLVAVGNRVYATLGIDAPVSALDAATGRTVRTYEESAATEEILYSQGILILLVDKDPGRAKKTGLNYGSVADIKNAQREYVWSRPQRSVMAIEAESGKVLWEKKQTVAPLSLATDGQDIFLHDGEKIVCLSRKNGESLWASKPVPRWETIRSYYGMTLVVYDGVVLFSGGEKMVPHKGGESTMTALDAKNGNVLWKAPHPPSGYQSPEDILVSGGLVWTGAVTNGRYSGIFTGRDPHTGEVKSEFPPDVETHWFHHRCYRARATDKYLLISRTGIEFVDTQARHWMPHHWVRGGCLYGIMPSNGLVYAPPHSCACYMESKQSGFSVLSPGTASRKVPAQVPDKGRLKPGPAYADMRAEGLADPEDWPTYRGNAARSGATQSAVGPKLGRAWRTELGGKLSSVTVASGTLYVAAIHTHTLYALDANSGKVRWSYVSGGRVDSPPTIYQGRVLFGSADGNVYCLRARDGALAWRFRAAPLDLQMTAFEQLESAWPVHGSVLVHNGALYCVAGRSMFVDGGLHLLRLDPLTGKKLSETVLDDRDPESKKNLQKYVTGLNMTVALPDVLSCDGKNIYMRSMPFDLDGKRRRLAYVDVRQQRGEDAHLFSPTGFLDGSYWHRSYWIFGRSMASGAGGYYLAGKVAPAGRILAFDQDHVYGFGRKSKYYRWTTPLEYQLFAADKEAPDFKKLSRRTDKSSGIRIENSDSLDPTGKPLTIQAWIKPGQPNGVILARGGPANGYALILQDGKPSFQIRSHNKLSAITGTEKLPRGWVHLAGVLSPDKKLHLYVNGKLASEARAGAFVAAPPAQPTEIGADDGGAVGEYQSPFGFKGVIDEVRVVHRALSSEEIQRAARAAKPAADKDLVIYLSFDNGDAADESGNKNNGRVDRARPDNGKFGKGMRFTGAKKKRKRRLPYIVQHQWDDDIPLLARAMLLANKTLFVAGLPDLVDEDAAYSKLGDPQIQAGLREQEAALEGSEGAVLWAVSAEDGKKVAELKLDSAPVWDSLAAARGRIYLAAMDGSVSCYKGKE